MTSTGIFVKKVETKEILDTGVKDFSEVILISLIRRNFFFFKELSLHRLFLGKKL